MGKWNAGKGSAAGRGTRGAVADVLSTGKRKAVAVLAAALVAASCVGVGLSIADPSGQTANDEGSHVGAALTDFFRSGLHLDDHTGPAVYREEAGKDFSVSITYQDGNPGHGATSTYLDGSVESRSFAMYSNKNYWFEGPEARRYDRFYQASTDTQLGAQSIVFNDFASARNAVITVDYPYIGDYNNRKVGAKLVISNIQPYLRPETALAQRIWDGYWSNDTDYGYPWNGGGEVDANRASQNWLFQPAIQICDVLEYGAYYDNIHRLDMDLQFYYIDNQQNRDEGKVSTDDQGQVVAKSIMTEDGTPASDIYVTMSSLSMWHIERWGWPLRQLLRFDDGGGWQRNPYAHDWLVAEKAKPLSAISAGYILDEDGHVYKSFDSSTNYSFSTSYDQKYPYELGEGASSFTQGGSSAAANAARQARIQAYDTYHDTSYLEDESDGGWYATWRGEERFYTENGNGHRVGDFAGYNLHSYDDTVGSLTFPKNAASMLFRSSDDVKFAVSSTANTMWFTVYPQGLTNMAPKAPLLLDNSKPHKAIFADDTNVHYPGNPGFGAGDDVHYEIQQKVNRLNFDSLVRYTDFTLEDRVPDAVEITDYYITKAVENEDGELVEDPTPIATRRNAGSVGTFSRWNYVDGAGNPAEWVDETTNGTTPVPGHWNGTAQRAANGQVVRFSFSDNYLQNTMELAGEYYVLHITGKVKDDAQAGEPLVNRGVAYLNNPGLDYTKYDHYHVSNTLYEEVQSTGAQRELTLENRDDTFVYTVSKLVPADADRLVVTDELEDVLEVVGEPQLVYASFSEGADGSITHSQDEVPGMQWTVSPTTVTAGDGQRQTVTVTLTDDANGGPDRQYVSNMRERMLTLTFKAKIREGVTDEQLLKYSQGSGATGSIPNTAHVNFTHDPNGGFDTNTVYVVPPFTPEKSVRADADGVSYTAAGNEANGNVFSGAAKGVHADVSRVDETFTFSVAYAVASNIDTLKFSDRLDDRFQLVEGRNNVVVKTLDDTGAPGATVASRTFTNDGLAQAGGKIEFQFSTSELRRIKGKKILVQFQARFNPESSLDDILASYESVPESDSYTHTGTPNKAAVTLTRDGGSFEAGTNTVTVTTSSTKDVGAVNGQDSAPQRGGTDVWPVSNRDDLFQYGVEYFVSGNAISVSMVDTLEPVLEMAAPADQHVRVFARDISADAAAPASWTSLPADKYSVVVGQTQDGKRQIVHVNIADGSVGDIKGKQVRFEFDAKIRATATDADLDAYLVRGNKIGNTATVFMNGEPRVTNEVDVTPPPEKDVHALDAGGAVDASRGNDDNTHLDLLKHGEVYRYAITERFDSDAAGVSITDILEHVLEFSDAASFGNLAVEMASPDANGGVTIRRLEAGGDYAVAAASGPDSKGEDSGGFTVSFNDTGANGTSVVAGNRVTVSFDARVKADADLSAYEYKRIQNDAVIAVRNRPEVRTNKVTVTPPPEKKVYTIDGGAVGVRPGDTDEHARTLYQTEPVTYRISDTVPENATKMEMWDTLNYLMELEGNNGGLKVYWTDENGVRHDVAWAISYAYPEVNFGTEADPNEQRTTRIHVTVTDPNLTRPAGEAGSLAGKDLVFEFQARLKPGLSVDDLRPYLNAATGKADVPNTAEVDVGGGARTTNEVLVTPPGRQDLRISKAVTQSVADEDFGFRVRFFDVRGQEMTGDGYLYEYDVVPTGKADRYTAADVVASGQVGSGDALGLKAGQTAVVKDVYVHVRYQVEELESSYYQQESVTVAPDNVDGAGAGEGRITADGPSTVAFTNEPKPGELRVKKVVPNVPADTPEPTFKLDVYLKGDSGAFTGELPYLVRNEDGTVADADSPDVVMNEDGSYRSTHKAVFQAVASAAEGTAVNVTDATGYGRATFDLKPNQTIVFPDLAAGMQYQVWEQDVSADWVNVSRENHVGTVTGGTNNAQVLITNENVTTPNKTVNGRTEVLLDQRAKTFEYKVSYRVPSNPFRGEYLGVADTAPLPDTLTFTFEDELEECLDLVGSLNGETIVWPDMPEGAQATNYATLSYEGDDGESSTIRRGVSVVGNKVSAAFVVTAGDPVLGKTVTLTLHAKIKDSYTDEQLLAKYGNMTVPNTGAITVENDGRVYKTLKTNPVHVTPPPTKAVDTHDGDTNQAKTDAILNAREKLFTYSISQTVPVNANTIRFEDTLKDVLVAARKDGDAVRTFDEEYAALADKTGLDFYALMQKYVTVTAKDKAGTEYAVVPKELVPAGSDGYIGVENTSGSAFSISVEGNELSLYVSGKNAEALRDKHVTVSFGAKIRSEATEHQLHTYLNNEIPNNAVVTINGQPMVTNEVVVVPPPFKEITTGDNDTNVEKTHANLSEADKVFTYEVKDKVPTMVDQVVMYDTLDDLLEFYPGTEEGRAHANVKVELHNNAREGTTLGGDDYTVSFGTMENGSFKEEAGGKTIRITLTDEGIAKAKANASESTGTVINNGSEIDFVFQAKVRPLADMSAENLARLHAYEAGKGGIPNVGTVDFGRGPRTTNEVTVVPPPEKKIQVTTASDAGSASTTPATSLVDFLTLQARDQVHTYRVMDSIPANAAGVTFDDDLESALELVMGADDLKGVAVYAFDYAADKTEPAEGDKLAASDFSSIDIDDGDIHLAFKDTGTGGDAKSVVAGKTVVVVFDAKIRDSATTGELERYVVRDGGVPNDATFSIGNTHRTTNTAAVVPPPRKLVDGELSRVLQNADQDFTYTVTDVVGTDGHDVVMTDVLEELLEPSTVDGVADGGLSVEMSSASFAKGEVKIDGRQVSVGDADADFTVEIDHGTVAMASGKQVFTPKADGNRIRVKVTMADTGEGDAKRSVAAGHAITFSFKARMKSTDGMTDEQRKDFDEKLRDYITEDSGVPNTATVQVNGHDPRVTNKVTVTPQPEKKVTKQGSADLREHENLDTKTQPFTYTIIHTVGADAEDVVFTDELDPVLELLMLERDEASTSVSDVVRVRVERGSVSAPGIDAAKSSIATVDGKQKLTVAFAKEADGKSAAAGKTVILEFRARIKADADLRPYLENVIENKGKYTIGATEQWTNTVTVTPPPEKKVNPDDDKDATLRKYDWAHYHLKSEGEAFTYSVSDRLPSNATGVVMEDTLEHVLELARTQDGKAVTFAEQAKDLDDDQKAALLKDYVVVQQDGHPIAESHYTVELLPATTEAGEATTMLRVTVADDRVSPDDPSLRVSHLAGHVAKFEFQAVIKEDADATPFLTKEEGESGEGVPNTATVKIAGTPRVTNEVTVVPTPVKKVTKEGGSQLRDHENLDAKDQAFTYTVADAFSDHATKVSLTDTLEPVLELLKDGDKYDVAVTSTNQDGDAIPLEYDSGTGPYSENDRGKKFRVGVTEADGRQTLTVWVTDDATRNAKVTFAFKARIKDGATDDDLEPYRQAGNLIPNTAMVSINGDARITNEVTVTPPPEKLVQEVTHYRVAKDGTPFTFSVTDYLPDNAVDVVMTDTLQPEFKFYPGEGGGNISRANVKVSADGRALSANDFSVELNGQKITVAVKTRTDAAGNEVSRVAGQRVTFSFDATLDADADVSKYILDSTDEHAGVPNEATVSVKADGQPEVKRTTNEVTVVPPPKKKVTKAGTNTLDDQVYLDARNQVFTYTVTDLYSKAATNVVMSDTLKEPLTFFLNDEYEYDVAVYATDDAQLTAEPDALRQWTKLKESLYGDPGDYELSFDDDEARREEIKIEILKDEAIQGKKVAYVFKAKIKDDLTAVEQSVLRNYLTHDEGVPNVATITVGGNPRTTNEVLVVPPPEKLVEGKAAHTLGDAEDAFTYTISDVVPANAATVTMTDTLDELLELDWTSGRWNVGVTANGTPLEYGTDFTADFEGQQITIDVLTIDVRREGSVSKVAGTAVTFSFAAKLRSLDDESLNDEQKARLRTVLDKQQPIENKGQVSFGGDPRITNTVTVTPPPTKTVENAQVYALPDYETAFTYKVSKSIPADAETVSFADELKDVLELAGDVSIESDAPGFAPITMAKADVLSGNTVGFTLTGSQVEPLRGHLLTVSFDARLVPTNSEAEHAALVEKLQRYVTEASGVKNTATFEIDGAGSITNTVLVEPPVEKRVEDALTYAIPREGDTFTYTVTAMLPADAEDVVLTDYLHKFLEPALRADGSYDVAVRTGTVALLADQVEVDYAANDRAGDYPNRLTVSLKPQGAKAVAGQTVTFSFEAKIREGLSEDEKAELLEMAETVTEGAEGVPNQATVSISGHEYQTNWVHVTPPPDTPVKEVRDADEHTNMAGDADKDTVTLQEWDEPFTYTVSVDVPAGTAKVEFSDQLNAVLAVSAGDVKVYAGSVAEDNAVAAQVSLRDNLLQFTLGSDNGDTLDVAGKTLIVVIPATVKPGTTEGELEEACDGTRTIANEAGFRFDNHAELKTKPVNVVPPEPAAVTLGKTVITAGYAGTDAFEFALSFEKAGAPYNGTVSVAGATEPADGNVDVHAGALTVKLASGQVATIGGLPAGVTVTAVEQAAAGFTQTDRHGAALSEAAVAAGESATTAAGETESLMFYNTVDQDTPEKFVKAGGSGATSIRVADGYGKHAELADFDEPFTFRVVQDIPADASIIEFSDALSSVIAVTGNVEVSDITAPAAGTAASPFNATVSTQGGSPTVSFRLEGDTARSWRGRTMQVDIPAQLKAGTTVAQLAAAMQSAEHEEGGQVHAHEGVPNSATFKVNNRADLRTDTVTVNPPVKGALEIAKDVTVNGQAVSQGATDLDREFTFTVTLANADGSAYAGQYAVDGGDPQTYGEPFTVKLKAGDVCLITGVAHGTRYTVAETPEAGYRQVQPAADGTPAAASGTIDQDAQVKAEFVNDVAELSPDKSVENAAGESVNGGNHAVLAAIQEVHKYTVIQVVPADATSIRFSDAINDLLQFEQKDAAHVLVNGTPQEVSLSFNDAEGTVSFALDGETAPKASDVAGAGLTVEFYAKAKDGVTYAQLAAAGVVVEDAENGSHSGVPNTASFAFNNRAKLDTDTVTVEFPNPGALAVGKTVSRGDSASQTFSFDVALKRADGAAYTGKVKVGGTYASVASGEGSPDADGFLVVNGGTVTLKLAGGQTAELSELPAGTTYTVTEAATAGYCQVQPADGAAVTGAIASGETAQARFENQVVEETPVKKVNDADHADLSRLHEPFTYTVTQKVPADAYKIVFHDQIDSVLEFAGDAKLSADGMDDRHYAGSNATNTLEFTIEGDSARAYRGKTVTVEFKARARADKGYDEILAAYRAVKDGAVVASDAEHDHEGVPNQASFTFNARPSLTTDTVTVSMRGLGDLTISKALASGTTDERFTFDVSVEYEGEPLSGRYDTDDPSKMAVFTDGTTTVELGQGESATIKGLPAGAAFTVAERVKGGFQVDAVNAPGATVGADHVVTGTIDDTGHAAEVAFINKTASDFSIEKRLTSGDTDELFTFALQAKGGAADDAPALAGAYEVEFSGKAADDAQLQGSSIAKSGDSYRLTFADGAATVKLHAGQVATVKEVPQGAQVAVTEQGADGWTLAEGEATQTLTVQYGKSAAALFVNGTDASTPEKKVSQGQASTDASHDTISIDRSKSFTYELSYVVPLNATTLEIADQVDALLQVDADSVTVTADGEDAAGAFTDTSTPAKVQLVATDAKALQGKAIVVRFDAMVRADVTDAQILAKHEDRNIPNTATVNGQDTNTVKVTTAEPGTLSISKKIEAGTTGEKFSFTITASESGANLKGEYPVEYAGATGTSEGSIAFASGVATVKIGQDETATITDLPAGATFVVAEESAAGFELVDVEAENATVDEDTLGVSGAVSGDPVAVTFTNAVVQEPPHKMVTARGVTPSWDDVHLDLDAVDQVYTYTIEQKVPRNATSVTFTDTLDPTLRLESDVEVSIGGESLEPSRYRVNGKTIIIALTGDMVEKARGKIVTYAFDAAYDTNDPDKIEASFRGVDADGNKVAVDDASAEHVGTPNYATVSISPTASHDGDSKYTNTTNTVTVQPPIPDVPDPDPARLDIGVAKTFADAPDNFSGVFVFNLTEGEGDTATTIDTATVRTSDLDGAGRAQAAFKTLEFAQEGTHTYTVSEVIPTGSKNVAYDPAVHTVVVDVKLNDAGTAYVPTVTVDGGRVTAGAGNTVTATVPFENRYVPDAASVALKLTKAVTGADIADYAGMFTFELEGTGSTELRTADGKETVLTATNDAEGNVIFAKPLVYAYDDGLDYSEGVEYTYEIREVAGADKHFAYVDKPLAVIVKVTWDKAAGKLVAKVSSESDAGAISATVPEASAPSGNALTGDNAVNVGTFTNPWTKPEPVTVRPVADKDFLNAKTRKAEPLAGGDFAFELVGPDGKVVTWKDADGKTVSTATNDKDGKVLLPELEFTYEDVASEPEKTKTFHYVVREVGADDEVASSATRPFDVIVSDNADGTLHVDYQTDLARTPFINLKLEKGAKFQVTAKKQLEGADLAANDFRFLLTGGLADGTGAVANPGTWYAYNQANGTILFDEIPIEAAGTYQFTVQEDVPTGDAADSNMTYDTSKHTVTVVAEEVADKAAGAEDETDKAKEADKDEDADKSDKAEDENAEGTDESGDGSAEASSGENAENGQGSSSAPRRIGAQNRSATSAAEDDAASSADDEAAAAAAEEDRQIAEAQAEADRIAQEKAQAEAEAQAAAEAERQAAEEAARAQAEAEAQAQAEAEAQARAEEAAKAQAEKEAAKLKAQAQAEAEAALNPKVKTASFDVAGPQLVRAVADTDNTAGGTSAATDKTGTTDKKAAGAKSGKDASVNTVSTHIEITKVLVDGKEVKAAKTAAAIDAGTFKNVYAKPQPAQAVLQAKKLLDDATPDRAFSFQLSAGGNTAGVDTPLPAGGATVAANNGQAVEFPAISFAQPGEYRYVLSEVDGGKTVDGVMMDAAVFPVTVTVASQADGTLKASVDYAGAGEAPTFKNYTDTPPAPGVGALEISKTLVDASAGATTADVEFSFVAVFLAPNGSALSGEYAYTGSRTGTFSPSEAGVAAFKLKAGEAIQISGLPEGAVYVVKEAGIPSGYHLESGSGSGIIAADAVAHAAFVNAVDEPEATTGSLVLSKAVAGATAADSTAFTFKLAFKDAAGASLSEAFPFSGSSTGTVASGGTVTLRDGEAIVVSGLPEGTAYTVEEVDIPKGYALAASSGAEGSITVADKVRTASFVNKKTSVSTKPDPTPDPGKTPDPDKTTDPGKTPDPSGTPTRTTSTYTTRQPTVVQTGVSSSGGKELAKTGDSGLMLALALAGAAAAAGGVALAAARRRNRRAE